LYKERLVHQILRRILRHIFNNSFTSSIFLEKGICICIFYNEILHFTIDATALIYEHKELKLLLREAAYSTQRSRFVIIKESDNRLATFESILSTALKETQEKREREREKKREISENGYAAM